MISARWVRQSVLCAALWLGICPGTNAQDYVTAGFLDGILSEMASGSSGDTADADILSAVADIMAVENTLRYLDNAFAPLPKSFHRRTGLSTNPVTGDAGRMALPVDGCVTSGFGYRPAFGRMHKGIDLHLHVGDTVRSALDGIVTRVSVDRRGYGLFVVVKHDGGLETRYGHLCRSLVSAGDRISAGEAIALGGNSGNSTGPHLHFETRQGGVAFDPALMFNFTPASR